jgi:hypothetical protein
MFIKNIIFFIVIHKVMSTENVIVIVDLVIQFVISFFISIFFWVMFDLWGIHEQFLIVLIFVHDFLALSFFYFHATKGCYLQSRMIIVPCGMDKTRINYHQNPNSFHIVYAIKPWPMKINQIFKTWWFF